jgi:hypothetical protein
MRVECAVTDKLHIVMISCRQREQARALTIPQFNDLGLAVSVHLSPCEPAGPIHNNLVSTHALHDAYAEGKHCLFIEDDIDLDAPLFRHFLELALLNDKVMYFYLHDKEDRVREFYGAALANRIMAGLPIRKDVYELNTTRELFGTQCVFLPYWFYAPIVENASLQATTHSFDVFLSQYLFTVKETPLVALPHPVQHRHDRTARSGNGSPMKYSLSYRLPWFEEGENREVHKDPVTIDFRAENTFQYEHLLPLWHALPWSKRGSFYVRDSALDALPGASLAKSISLMHDGPSPTVIMNHRTSAWSIFTRRDAYPKRHFITVGGSGADVEFERYSYPYSLFASPDFPSAAGEEFTVGLLLANHKAFARHCRQLLEVIQPAVRAAAHAKSLKRTVVHADRLSISEPVHMDDDARFVGVALDDFRGAAKQWFQRHGILFASESLHVLRLSSVIVTDDGGFLDEAMQFGKPVFMMHEGGVSEVGGERRREDETPPSANAPSMMIREVLEGLNAA